MKKKRSRVIPLALVLACAGGVGYWYADSRGWFEDRGPTNLPTAEERARMEEIDRSSALPAPQAKAGVGVVPKGSTPPPPPPEIASTTTATGTPPLEIPLGTTTSETEPAPPVEEAN